MLSQAPLMNTGRWLGAFLARERTSGMRANGVALTASG
jgi:hypothetical protein